MGFRKSQSKKADSNSSTSRRTKININIKEEYELGVDEPLETKHQRPNDLLIFPFSRHFLIIPLLDLIMRMT